MKTTETIRNMKGKEKIVGLTAYDYQMVQILDGAGVDFCLSEIALKWYAWAMKIPCLVTLEEMIHHGKAVKRGIKEALLVIEWHRRSNDSKKGAFS